MAERAVLSFVPQYLLRKFNENPKRPAKYESNEFFASVLFIDVSGFTALNEKFSKLGPSGAEQVNKHLNTYFGSLIETSYSFGGDVLKFAGDALIVLFGDKSSDKESLFASTYRAVACGLAIQQNHREYSADGVTLTVHVGVGSGNVTALIVGGERDCWEFLVAGEPFSQLESCVELSKAGEVVISPEAFSIIKEKVKATERSGCWLIEYLIAFELNKVQPLQPAHSDSIEALRCFVQPPVLKKLDSGFDSHLWMADLRRVTVLFINIGELSFSGKTKVDLRILNMVLVTIQSVILQYEGFIRQFLVDDKGTVLIAAFGIPLQSHEDDIIRAVQSAAFISYHLHKLHIKHAIGITTGKCFCGNVGNDSRREYAIVGHTVNMSARLMKAAKEGVLVDEKTFKESQKLFKYDILEPVKVKGAKDPVPVFRLHVHAAVKMQKSPGEKRYKSAAKTVGRKKEMKAIENVIRGYMTERASSSLTAQSKSSEDTIHGESSQEKLENSEKKPSEKEEKKGKKEKKKKEKKPKKKEKKEVKIVKSGKEEEKSGNKPKSYIKLLRTETVRLTLSDLDLGYSTNKNTKGGTFFIIGEAGIGKSTLLHFAEQTCKKLGGFTILRGDSSSIERTSPFYVCRRIFQQLLSNPIFADLAAYVNRYQLVESSASSYEIAKSTSSHNEEETVVSKKFGRIAEYLPLFNIVLNARIPENSFTRFLGEGGRAYKTVEGLARWVHMAVHRLQESNEKIVILIEDAHWIDSLSWQLFLALRDINPLLILITTRPLEEPLSIECRTVYQASQKIDINKLTIDEVIQLACSKIYCDSMDASVAKIFEEKANGNPFFINEIVQSLLENSQIENVEQESEKGTRIMCKFRGDLDLKKINIPSSIEQIILSRLDKLSPNQQMLLKIGSCLGMDVNPKTLKDIAPKAIEENDMKILEEREFFVKEDQGEGKEYRLIWKHKIMQEAIYNGLTDMQKKTIHSNIVEWYQKDHEDSMEGFYGLLAHHLKECGKTKEAIDYYEKAAEGAFNVFARNEAINLYQQAIDLDSHMPDYPEKRLRHARWRLNLTESYVSLAMPKEAKEQGEKALQLCNQPFLFRGFNQKIQIVKQLITQLSHFKKPEKYKGKLKGVDAEYAKISAKVFGRLTTVLAFEGENVMESVLRSLNLAEQAGDCNELCFGYYIAGIGFGIVGKNEKMAMEYFRRAESLFSIADNLTIQTYYLTRAVFDGAYGRWKSCEDFSIKAREISERMGDAHNAEGAISIETAIRMLSNPVDYQITYEACMPLIASAERRFDYGFNSGFSAIVFHCLLEMDRLEEVEIMNNFVDKIIPNTVDINSLVSLSTNRMRFFYRLGKIEEAIVEARNAASLLESAGELNLFYVVINMFNLNLILLDMYAETSIKESLALQTRVFKVFHKYTKIFRIAGFMTPFFKGMKSWFSKDFASACSYYIEAYHFSERHETHFYSTVILHYMGKLCPNGEQRTKLLNYCLNFFENAKTIWHADKVGKELSRTKESLEQQEKLMGKSTCKKVTKQLEEITKNLK